MRSRSVLSVVIAILVTGMLNVEAFSIISNISVSNGPYELAVDDSSNMVYVTNKDSDTISVIDGSTNTAVDTVQVDRNPHGIAINPETHRLYVANYGSGTFSLIDGSATEIRITMPKVGAYGVAVNPTTDKVYITNADFNSVTVMSSRTDKIIDTISVGSSPRGITVNPVTNNVYVANYESDSVTVIESTIDGVKDKVVTTIPVGSTPYGIAVNPATNKVYVANSGSNSVSVIDISINRTNRVIDTIEVGHNPVGVAINQNTNMIYVTNFNSNSVSMIDGSADEVMDTIEVGHNPSGIDINSRTDIVYVANYGSNSVSVIDTKNTLMSVEGNESKLTDNETSVHVDAPERFYIDVDGERDYAEITSDAFISGFQYEGELKKISFTVESEEESKTVLTIPKQFSIEPPDVFTTGYIFPPVVTHGNDGWTIMLKHEQGSHDVVIQGVGANVVATTESEDSSTLSGKNNSTLDGIANWFTDFLNSILKFLGLSSVQR